MLAFLFTASAAASAPTTLVDVVAITKPYVDCRRAADQKIIVLQQKIQARRRDEPNYNYYSDPDYTEIQEAVLKAEKDCNLQKYVAVVKNKISLSNLYDDFQKQKMTEFLIDDVIKLQWTFLNAQSGTYRFPMITVVQSHGMTNKNEDTSK